MKSAFALAVLAVVGNVCAWRKKPFASAPSVPAMTYGAVILVGMADGAIIPYREGDDITYPPLLRYLATRTNGATQAFAVPTESSGGHPDAPLVPLQHEHAAREARASTKALQWIGPIAPNGEVYAYYGGLQDVSMKWIEINNRFAAPQVHHVEKLQRRQKGGVVCSRVDQPSTNYAETWAAYKLAAVLGSLAATNTSAVVAIDGGYGHCVDLTACDEHERARVQLCNDNPKPMSIKIQTIAEYTYGIIYECAKQDGSGLIWGQQFDTKNWNVIVSACPKNAEKKGASVVNKRIAMGEGDLVDHTE